MMILKILLAFIVLAEPALAASNATPKLNARIGSAEKPYTSAGAYKWWDTSRSDGSGTVMDHVTVTAEQRGVNIEKPISNLAIRDSAFIGKKPVDNGQYPAGIFAKRGTNLLVERTTIRDWKTIADSKYRQGDCFLAEWDFVGIVLRDVTLSGCTDGGYDGKARNVLLDRVTSTGNKISYRFWYATVKATNIESVNPTEAHFQLNNRKDGAHGMGAGGIVADKVTFRSTGQQVLLSLEPNSVVTIGQCVIDVPVGTAFIKYRNGGNASNVKLTLGKTCAMDAKGYAINTPVVPIVTAPRRGFDAGEVLPDRDGDGLVKLGAGWAKKLKIPTGTTVRSTGGTWYEIAK